MKSFLRSFSCLLLALCATTVSAQNAPGRQNLSDLQILGEQFLRNQAGGLPGTVNVTMTPIDPRRTLLECPAPQPFAPVGSRPMGRTTVGIRCMAPVSWTVYIAATVQVIGEYLISSGPLSQGQMITARDLARVKGDLSAMPNGVVTDEAQAIGRTTAIALPAGAPLRQDVLRTQWVVQQGQSVRLVSSGPGFEVAVEGRAMSNAGEGQPAQVKTPNGQVVTGTAHAGGVVNVGF